MTMANTRKPVKPYVAFVASLCPECGFSEVVVSCLLLIVEDLLVVADDLLVVVGNVVLEGRSTVKLVFDILTAGLQ